MDRNRVEKDGWILQKVEDYSVTRNFDCGDDDLNEFFTKDAFEHDRQLLTQTYMLHEATMVEKGDPVAFVSFCNDAVRLKDLEDYTALPPEKRYPSIPAVKIARLAVAKGLQRKNIGTHLVNMIKQMFMTHNRTGCRLLTVDAYNKPAVIAFYQKNGFDFLREKEKKREHPIMYFDLISLQLD